VLDDPAAVDPKAVDRAPTIVGGDGTRQHGPRVNTDDRHPRHDHVAVGDHVRRRDRRWG
jgi:hypothetical protein